jgi:2-amino-4-hydroxy-6-hydroxymethyldihydropteridine diphosphokinase
LPDCAVKKTSSLYRTAPLETLPGHAPGDDYINAVVEIETLLTAPTLLQHLQQTELAAGRERPYINAPRTLDLDLLLYGNGRIDSTHLTVPHPRMWQRAFVLVPLAEIAPHLVNATQLDAVKLQKTSRLVF